MAKDEPPKVTARVTRRQSREMARREEEESDEVQVEVESKAPVTIETIDLLLDEPPTSSAQKKGPSRRKMKKADPTQCLDIISPMYSFFYEQEVNKSECYSLSWNNFKKILYRKSS